MASTLTDSDQRTSALTPQASSSPPLAPIPLSTAPSPSSMRPPRYLQLLRDSETLTPGHRRRWRPQRSNHRSTPNPPSLLPRLRKHRGKRWPRQTGIDSGTFDVEDLDTSNVVNATLHRLRWHQRRSRSDFNSFFNVSPDPVIDAATNAAILDWNFDSLGTSFEFLADGETLTLTYQVTVDDGVLNDQTTVEINITGTNDQPTITGGPVSKNIAESDGLDQTGITLTDSGTFDVEDLDTSNVVNATSLFIASAGTNADPALNGVDFNSFFNVSPDPVIDAATNAAILDWNFDSLGTSFEFLADGETLTLTYQVTVDDGVLNDQTTVEINITGTNDQPTITGGPVSKNIAESDGLDQTGITLTDSGTFDVEDLDTSNVVNATSLFIASAGTNADPALNGVDFNSFFNVSPDPVIDAATNAAILDWNFDSLGTSFEFLADGETLTLTYQVTVDDGVLNDQTTVEINITGTNDQPTITGGPVSKNIAESDGLDQIGIKLTDSGTFDVEDLDTSNVVNATSLFIASAGTNADPALNGVDFNSFFNVSPDPVIDAATNAAILDWNFDSLGTSFEFLADGETLTLTYQVTVDDGVLNDQTTVEINITGTNDQPTITGGPVSKNIAESERHKPGLDQTGITLTDSGTFDVEDLDTSNVVNATSLFIASAGTNADPALNGVDFNSFFNVSPDPVIDAATNAAILDWNFDSLGTSFEFLADGETLTLTYQVTVDDGVLNDQTTVEINITGTNDQPTITGGPVSKDIPESADADQTGIQLSDSGTFDVEDLDTSNVVNATSLFIASAGTNADPALNGVDFNSFFNVSPDPVIDAATNAAILDWNFDSLGTSFEFLADGETLTLTYQVTVDDGVLNDQTTVEINITGTNDQPTITGGPVSKNIAESDGLDQTGITLTDSGTFDVEDLDTSNVVNATSLFIASAGTNADPALNGVDFNSFFNVSPDPVIDAATNAAILDWNFDSLGTSFEFLADGETLTLTYQVTVDDGVLNDQTTVEINITGTNDQPTITGGPVSKNIAESDGLDQTGITLTDSGTFDVEDLDTSNVVNATSLFIASAGTNADPALNGVDFNSFFNVSPDPVIDAATNAAILDWNFDSLGTSFEFLADGETLTLTYQVTVDDGVLNDQTTVEINITGTNDQPTITGGPVSKNIAESDGLDQTGITLTDSGTFDVEDLDTSNVVNATSLFIASAGTNADPALNGVDFNSFFNVSPDPVIDAATNAAILDWNFDSLGTSFEFLADGETLTLTYQVTVDDGVLNDQTTVEINITGTNDQPTITGGPVSKNIAESDGLDQTGITLTDSGTFDVEDLDTSNVVNANSSFTGTAGNANPLDPALNGVDFDSFFHVSPDPVIDANTNTAILDWNFDSLGTSFEFLADGETLTLTYQVTVDDGVLNDQTTVEINITGTNDQPTITGGPVSKNIAESDGLDQTGITLTDSRHLRRRGPRYLQRR